MESTIFFSSILIYIEIFHEIKKLCYDYNIFIIILQVREKGRKEESIVLDQI